MSNSYFLPISSKPPFSSDSTQLSILDSIDAFASQYVSQASSFTEEVSWLAMMKAPRTPYKSSKSFFASMANASRITLAKRPRAVVDAEPNILFNLAQVGPPGRVGDAFIRKFGDVPNLTPPAHTTSHPAPAPTRTITLQSRSSNSSAVGPPRARARQAAPSSPPSSRRVVPPRSPSSLSAHPLSDETAHAQLTPAATATRREFPLRQAGRIGEDVHANDATCRVEIARVAESSMPTRRLDRDQAESTSTHGSSPFKSLERRATSRVPSTSSTTDLAISWRTKPGPIVSGRREGDGVQSEAARAARGKEANVDTGHMKAGVSETNVDEVGRCTKRASAVEPMTPSWRTCKYSHRMAQLYHPHVDVCVVCAPPELDLAAIARPAVIAVEELRRQQRKAVAAAQRESRAAPAESARTRDSRSDAFDVRQGAQAPRKEPAVVEHGGLGALVHSSDAPKPSDTERIEGVSIARTASTKRLTQALPALRPIPSVIPKSVRSSLADSRPPSECAEVAKVLRARPSSPSAPRSSSYERAGIAAETRVRRPAPLDDESETLKAGTSELKSANGTREGMYNAPSAAFPSSVTKLPARFEPSITSELPGIVVAESGRREEDQASTEDLCISREELEEMTYVAPLLALPCKPANARCSCLDVSSPLLRSATLANAPYVFVAAKFMSEMEGKEAWENIPSRVSAPAAVSAAIFAPSRERGKRGAAVAHTSQAATDTANSVDKTMEGRKVTGEAVVQYAARSEKTSGLELALANDIRDSLTITSTRARSSTRTSLEIPRPSFASFPDGAEGTATYDDSGGQEFRERIERTHGAHTHGHRKLQYVEHGGLTAMPHVARHAVSSCYAAMDSAGRPCSSEEMARTVAFAGTPVLQFPVHSCNRALPSIPQPQTTIFDDINVSVPALTCVSKEQKGCSEEDAPVPEPRLGTTVPGDVGEAVAEELKKRCERSLISATTRASAVDEFTIETRAHSRSNSHISSHAAFEPSCSSPLHGTEGAMSLPATYDAAGVRGFGRRIEKIRPSPAGWRSELRDVENGGQSKESLCPSLIISACEHNDKLTMKTFETSENIRRPWPFRSGDVWCSDSDVTEFWRRVENIYAPTGLCRSELRHVERGGQHLDEMGSSFSPLRRDNTRTFKDSMIPSSVDSRSILESFADSNSVERLSYSSRSCSPTVLLSTEVAVAVFALVSAIIRTCGVSYLGHPLVGERSPYRLWDREGIGTGHWKI
ncbi:hypothetical protein B0H13DRAFT_2301886 [Mycena leptocephala]|nr:hypothetical protein B0H13DRAFT_2301886 [Mycena leptocephala]